MCNYGQSLEWGCFLYNFFPKDIMGAVDFPEIVCQYTTTFSLVFQIYILGDNIIHRSRGKEKK
jgi:hypothetical protein